MTVPSTATPSDVVENRPGSMLASWLGTMNMGVEYVRAAGNTLYHRDGSGAEIAVLDHACGFGSLVFGHHHPEIVEHAKAVLDAGVPVHAQLSWQPAADRVAGILDSAIARETGRDELHHAIFANSGAEAIEICMKHAELERGARLTAQSELVANHLERARQAVSDGAVVTDPDGLLAVGPDAGIEAVIAEILAVNARRRARPPVWLTLEHSFHGKLVGSIQVTQNEPWRTPFTALAAGACFLPADESPAGDAARRGALDAHRVGVLDLVVDDGPPDRADRTVRVVEHPLPVVAGFLVEPVRGGAGMHPVTPGLAEWIRRTCAGLGCPLIVDEVQSGMGRTGGMLACARLGLVGDYYAFAKNIAGGVAKNAVALVRTGRFRPEFEVLHSSTFARDGFSTRIALKVLEMLEADDGAAYRVVTKRGGRLRTALEEVCAEFDDVLVGVHGLGLMLAVQLRDQSQADHEGLRELARAGILGFALCGFLLHEHRIRTVPAGPRAAYLRFSPSMLITDEEIATTAGALRALATALRSQDGAFLLARR